MMMIRFVASSCAGTALIVAIFFLKETNPKLVHHSSSTPSTDSTTNPTSQPHLHVTSLMIICFIYEFCVRFSQAGYNSRYGIYVTNKFGINSVVFS